MIFLKVFSYAPKQMIKIICNLHKNALPRPPRINLSHKNYLNK